MTFTRKFLRKLIIGLVWNMASLAVLLFLPAWTLDWWRAWVIVGVVGLCFAVMMIGVLRTRPDLMRERFKSIIQKGQPLVDRVLLTAFVVSYTAIIIFIPVDVFYLHLLPKPDVWVSSIGMALYVGGWLMMALVFKENVFAAPVVRHQAEREHKVVDTGVYRLVRHPMYSGMSCAKWEWRCGWSRMRPRSCRSFPSCCWRRGSSTRNAFCSESLRATMRTRKKCDFD